MKIKIQTHGVDMNKIKQGAIASAVITASLLSSGCSSSGDDEFPGNHEAGGRGIY